MPPIATQYIRDRKLHDSTAKRWTELYARPKPPTPPPAPAPVPAPSAKSRGKKKDAELPGSSRAAARETIAIDIDDSDAEGGGSTRRSVQLGAGTKRRRGETAFALDDEGEEIEVREALSGNKKRAVGATRVSRSTTASGSSRRPAASKQLGDVIVIDDD